jgi:ABC transporter substrate binding protein (PQQ-dependent alcohol dehydrogenase system)
MIDAGLAPSPGCFPAVRRQRRLPVALLAVLAGAVLPAADAASAEPARVTIGYVDIADDPRHEPIRGYERLILKRRDHPFAGAQVALEEARGLARALNAEFVLERITVKSAADVAAAAAQVVERGLSFLLVDAPADAFAPLAAGLRGRPALAFNVTAPDDVLRRDLCAREIVHAYPSQAMLSDALVQHLMSRKWRDVLVLQGPLPADALAVRAFETSAKKFGARIVATKPFKPGSDPRERELNNPALLTAGNRDYDVVFVADEAFDFARQLSYRTARARPVVGAIDLEPVAWHWTFERYGAPQLNGRFEKLAGRRMEGADWAAWFAARMVVKAVQGTRSAEFGALRDFILGGASFDGAKGLALSVRPWDRQVRQAILLAAPYAVVASAPVEGFLHRLNTLDTLGDDEGETPCRLNR